MANVRYAARREDASSQTRAQPVRATATALWAFYETDPEIIAAVLPKPLEPADEPIVHLSIGQVEMESGAGWVSSLTRPRFSRLRSRPAAPLTLHECLATLPYRSRA